MKMCLVIPMILTATHKDVFDMPTIPTIEMTVLSEKRVSNVLRLLGWEGGFEGKEKEFVKVAGRKTRYRSSAVANR